MQIRCRNCGAYDKLPDYHAATLVKCPVCQWQEVFPARRHIATALDGHAGVAFAAREEHRSRIREALGHLRHLAPADFDRFCGELLQDVGYEVVVCDRLHDGSHALDLRWQGERLFAECRIAAIERPVTRREIEDLAGAMRHSGVKRGVFMTTGVFAPDGDEAAEALGIELIDGEELVGRMEIMEVARLSEWVERAKSREVT